MREEIKAYIEHWNKHEEKPCNEPRFVADFIEFIECSEADQWEFSGENGYCGFTATVTEFPSFIPKSGLGFELAYGKDFVKVFTDRHSGFWVPEYINLKGKEAETILAIIKQKLVLWAGV